MKSSLIKIGNSRGIRIPHALIEELDLQSEIELKIVGNHLEIHPAEARAGWDAAFAQADTSSDLSFDLPQNEWDNLEWQW